MSNTTQTPLSPTRPYIVRALHHWMEDNFLTPYLMVDTSQPNVDVPTEHIQDGRIVLNLSTQATGNLEIANDFIHFFARFNGVSREIWVPMPAIIGIYAKEDNNQGAFFDPSEYDGYLPDSQTANQKSATRPKRENKAGLKMV